MSAIDIKELTPQERSEIKQNLYAASEVLYNAGCVEVSVPDFDLARALVTGDNAVLKEQIEELSNEWGVGSLNHKKIDFIIVDFAKFREPTNVLAELISKIPDVRSIEVANQRKRFSDLYPGLIIAIIAAERIPTSVDASILTEIAKANPVTIFDQERV